MQLDLSGTRALVCGSNKGIGLASAMAIAEAGGTVTLFARNEDALREALGQLSREEEQEHDLLVADFTDPAEVAETLERHLSGTGHRYQVLVNNSGGPAAGPILDAEAGALEGAFKQHLVVNQLLTSLLVPGMLESNYGRIINIISTSVKQPIDGLGVSNTIRGAVANWSKTLAGELGRHGITVNNLLPGYTRTERLESLIASRAKVAGKTEAEITAAMQAEIPLKRFADPSEIGAVVAFLASPLAAYISGSNITVDGGKTKSL